MSERQYVIFKLGKGEYGAHIMYVKEIIEYVQCTKVPNTSNFIEGIINYRGDIVPIINLHYKFNIAPTDITENTRIIIFVLSGKQIGFLVDDASKVLTISDKDIEEPPYTINASELKFIKGIGKVDNSIVIILNLEDFLNNKEKDEIKQVKKQN